MIRLELPFPPPLSACFKDVKIRTKGGGFFTSRAPTGRYLGWQKEAARSIRVASRRNDPESSVVLMPGQVRVVIRLVAPDKRERDADNTGKAIMDSLVKNFIIENDSNRFVKRLTFAWEDAGLPCVVIVKPFIRRSNDDE